MPFAYRHVVEQSSAALHCIYMSGCAPTSNSLADCILDAAQRLPSRVAKPLEKSSAMFICFEGREVTSERVAEFLGHDDYNGLSGI